MDLAHVRRPLPGATQLVFLDAAAISITSTRAVEAVTRFVELVTRDPRAARHGKDGADLAAGLPEHLGGGDDGGPVHAGSAGPSRAGRVRGGRCRRRRAALR